MLNQFYLVGRLAKKPTLEVEGNKKESEIILSVVRSFKNEEGIYETDFIKCTLTNNLAENVFEYCTKEDLIGIKGRIQSKDMQVELVADKVTFLTSKKESEEE